MCRIIHAGRPAIAIEWPPARRDVEREMSTATACAVLAILLGQAGIASAQDSDAARQGAPAYRLCAACHSLKPGVHLSGPSLAEVWGKSAARNESYGRYTEALKKVSPDISWDENTLNAWIADPQTMVPGTTMTFRGIKDNQTRSNLIAFLRLALAPGGDAAVVRDGLVSARLAEGQIPPNLSLVENNQRIKDIHHCRDAYYVTTADGAQFPFWETNVRMKTDSSARGPKKGEPVLLSSGMTGDRVSIVFSSLADLKAAIAERC
jgi:cytochrome c